MVRICLLAAGEGKEHISISFVSASVEYRPEFHSGSSVL